MIMYPGGYSGVLEAGRHYVPLAPDHSNMEEVVDVLRDPHRAGWIIENAYKEIACSGKWTYKSFVTQFDRVIDEEVSKKGNDAIRAAQDAQASYAKFEARARRLESKSRLWFQRVKFSTVSQMVRRRNAVISKAETLVHNIFSDPTAHAVIVVGRKIDGMLLSVLRRLRSVLRRILYR
jgi:hypothetical protein